MTPYTMADAEAEMRAAIDSGERERIDAAAALVDRLETMPAVVTLHSAALWYVSVGLRVFPLSPGSKMPFPKCEACKGPPKCPGPETCGHDLCHGFKDASTDPGDITRWWSVTPEANIGIATGHVVDVVDIDGPIGHQSRAQHWDEIFAKVDRDQLAKVLTPRPGGMHVHVPATGDGNSTGIVTGVDYRGVGGYALMPPSVIAPGGKDAAGTYRFLGVPALADLTIAEAG